jgi:hypothetical protein
MKGRLVSYISLCALVGGLIALAGGIASFISSNEKDIYEYGLALCLVTAGLLGWVGGVCLSRRRGRSS